MKVECFSSCVCSSFWFVFFPNLLIYAFSGVSPFTPILITPIGRMTQVGDGGWREGQEDLTYVNGKLWGRMQGERWWSWLSALGSGGIIMEGGYSVKTHHKQISGPETPTTPSSPLSSSTQSVLGWVKVLVGTPQDWGSPEACLKWDILLQLKC